MNNRLKTSSKIALFLVVFSQPVRSQVPNHHLFYWNDKRAPLTTLDIVFPGAGSIRDDMSKAGLAVTAARLMEDYSKNHGYAARLEALGTELDFSTYYEYQVISISNLSENLTESVRIVNELMRGMTVTEFGLEEAKRKLLESYEKIADDGDHGLLRNYALSQTVGLGRWFSREALKQITLEEARKNCTAFLNANVVFFKAISDLDSTAVEKALLPITENRPRGGFVWALPTREGDPLPGHSAFVFEQYSQLKNVYCRWIIPIGWVNEENYVPNMVSWTLGRGTGRGLLYQYLRVKSGLAYGTSCSFRREADVRFLDIYADPRLENSEALITRMHEFIAGLAGNQDFWGAISELRKNPDAVEAHIHGELTPQRELDHAADRAMFNYPRREGGINSVTDDEIRSFLQKYFAKENLILMLFGPKDHIVEILEKHWPEITIHVQPVEKAIE